MRWKHTAAFLLIVGVHSSAANAEISGGVVKIGVLADQSSVFSASSGAGSVEAAKMAIEEFKGAVAGAPIELVVGDHLNKADVGSAMARKWIDQDGVDTIVDLGNSAVALAVALIASERDKAILVSSGGSNSLTGAACTPITVHWTYDSWSIANALATRLVKLGFDSWYFITADYAYGQDLENMTRSIVESGGGKVLGSVRHPLNANDFASYLLQAQASKAKVVALANGGGDTANSIKQAREFGLARSGQTIIGLSAMIADIDALGLEAAQGTVVADAFYWDMNDATRKFSRRWSKRNQGRMPTMLQAGVYSVVVQYLKAVEAANSDAGHVVVNKMKEKPMEDALFGTVTLRPDGRAIHPMYLWQVKSPSESKEPWDYMKPLASVPADQAFRPMSEGGCPLVK
jgi:branched-chain amino acid transport system substrate-binding protein